VNFRPFDRLSLFQTAVFSDYYLCPEGLKRGYVRGFGKRKLVESQEKIEERELVVIKVEK